MVPDGRHRQEKESSCRCADVHRRVDDQFHASTPRPVSAALSRSELAAPLGARVFRPAAAEGGFDSRRPQAGTASTRPVPFKQDRHEIQEAGE